MNSLTPKKTDISDILLLIEEFFDKSRWSVVEPLREGQNYTI
jgi:hypothetical protein